MKTSYLLIIVAILFASFSGQAITPVVHNGRLNFTLVGYGCYSLLCEDTIVVDGRILEEGFEFRAFFRQLASIRNGEKPVNLVRVGVNYHRSNSLTPFMGVPKHPNVTDRRDRYAFDLNPQFFARLEQFVSSANDFGIVVQLTIFDGVALEADNRLRFHNSPYNQRCNRDKATAIANPRDFFMTTGPLWEVNRGLIDALCRTVAKYPNLIWEVMNEPSSNSGAKQEAIINFHRHVIDRLAGRGAKLISVNADSPVIRSWAETASRVSLISVHLSEYVDLDGVNYKALLSATKPTIISTDGHQSCSASKWDNFTRARFAKSLTRALDADGPRDEGRVHIEFLDDSILGNTHGSLDYDPRLFRVKSEVITALKRRR